MRMSFDIYGGIKALQVLKDFGATVDQAEAVAEAIIRHQDMGVDGTIGQLIQLATLYDNTGTHPRVKDFEKPIHPETRRQVNEAHPRLKWCSFFAIQFARRGRLSLGIIRPMLLILISRWREIRS
ncbi:hypothetical protein BJX63DRAFT_416426 [Aspergillus granulosus]|uniref:Uncharacterized protein n=1 Tax=Aspergillus granulosus TaxID=176169 RepID=A0ABR4GRZ8_9EURO